jgi:hypothetical protein
VEHEPDDEPLLRSTRLPPVSAAAVRSSLDDRRTHAQELREALDQLKAELDGGAGPAAPADPAEPAQPAPSELSQGARATNARREAPAARGRRLALVAVVAVGVLAAAVGVVRVVAWSLAGADGVAAPSAARPSASASAPPAPPRAAATPGSPATPTPSSPPEAGRPAVLLPEGLPSTGPGADAPGAELTAVVTEGGAVDVYERLVMRAGTTSVRLAPAPAAALPPGLRAAPIRVDGLRVDLDGRAATPRPDQQGWRVTPADAAAFTQVVVHYRLAGALVRVAPAPPGRATLVLRPLTGPTALDSRDPVLVRLDDRRVGDVYCPAAPEPLCAVTSGTRHVATVPAGARPIVLAQVTLR